jgi:hypothetical protein
MNKIYPAGPVRLKVKYFIMFFAFCYIVFNPSLLFSFSIGGYFTTHYGEYDWNINKSTLFSNYIVTAQNPPAKSRPVMPGGGIIWDLYFFEDQFIFRQNLGLEALISRQFKMTQFSLVNTFAYVPLRTDSFLIWFGPQLNLHYLWGKDAKNKYGLLNNLTVNNFPVSIRRNYEFVTIGAGLALGLDYDIYDNIKLSFETGFNVSTSAYGQSHDIGNAEASVFGYEGYVSVSVMYRVNEKRRPKEL